jgi:hypothetical protein
VYEALSYLVIKVWTRTPTAAIHLAIKYARPQIDEVQREWEVQIAVCGLKLLVYEALSY